MNYAFHAITSVIIDRRILWCTHFLFCFIVEQFFDSIVELFFNYYFHFALFLFECYLFSFCLIFVCVIYIYIFCVGFCFVLLIFSGVWMFFC